MIGWMSFVSAISVAVQVRIPWPWWAHLGFGLLVTGLAVPALIYSFLAYRTQEMEPWPHGQLAYEKYGNEEDHTTRAIVIVIIENAIKVNAKIAAMKARYVGRAIWLLGTLSLLMLASLFASFIL